MSAFPPVTAPGAADGARGPQDKAIAHGEEAREAVSHHRPARIPFLAHDPRAVRRVQADLVAALAGIATLADEFACGLTADPAEVARRCGHRDATLGRFLAAFGGQGAPSAEIDDVAAAFAHKAAANAERA